MDRRSFLKSLGLGAGAVSLLSTDAFADIVKPNSTAISPGQKILIAHRGASAYAPENTLAAYKLAIEQGADLVEQDLQITKDHELICMHDMTLETTTDAAKVFPDRFIERTEHGKKVKRWMIYNFTLAEIKQLKSRSRDGHKALPPTTVPTWQEAIDTIRGKAGLCPETKGPDFYGRLGFNMEELVAKILKKNNLTNAGYNTKMPVLMQSFSKDGLLRLKKLGINGPTLWLSSSKTDWTPAMLAEAAKYFTTIGPYFRRVTAESVKQAHAHKLQVIPYTFQKEELKKYPNLPAQMSHYLYEIGIDGLFTNNPDKFPRKPVAAKVKETSKPA